MRITWGATVFALAVVVAGAGSYMTPVHADQGGAPAANITVESFPALMKTISSTQTSLRAKMKENNLADAAKDAQIIASTFGDVEKFFASRSKADGVKWAQEGRTGATAVAGALAAGDAMKAQGELKTMAGSCASCHMAYREGGPQAGGYKFKEGSI
jgi:hypothetical protein